MNNSCEESTDFNGFLVSNILKELDTEKHKCAHLTHKLAALPWEMQIIIFKQYST